MLRPCILLGVTLSLFLNAARAADYTVAGWPITVTFEPQNKSPVLGEPVILQFTILNRSTENLQVAFPRDMSTLDRPAGFHLIATDATGHDLPAIPTRGGGAIDGPPFWSYKLPAGKPVTIPLYLWTWVTIDKPGLYTIQIARDLHFSTAATPLRSPTEGAPLNVELKTQLAMQPYDKEKLGTVIKTIGEAATAKTPDHWSLFTLSAINDDRAIPYLVKAITSGDYDRKFEAMPALAKFKSDAALIALKKAATTTENDIEPGYGSESMRRTSAVQTRTLALHMLTNSAHPGARSVLLSMRHDESPAIRIAVMKAFYKTASPAERALIVEMTHDPDPDVSQTARDLLKQIPVTPR